MIDISGTLAACLVAREYDLESTTEIFVEELLVVFAQLCTTTGALLFACIKVEIVNQFKYFG